MERLARSLFIMAACLVWLGIGSAGAQYERLHEFGAGNDGANPFGALTLRGSSIYGMTSEGGTGGNGTLFSIKNDGSDYSLIRSFAGGVSDGATPMGAVTMAWSLLGGTTTYGMTAAGGVSNAGTIFKRHVPSILGGITTYTLLHSFDGGAGGNYPMGDLLLSGSTLYGMTESGGASDRGVIFKIGTGGTGFAVLHSFAGGTGDGAYPGYNAKLAISGSTLYGVCAGGGANGQGTIFCIGTDGTGYAVIHDFGGATDGSGPNGGVVLADGYMYGTTAYGGVHGYGVIFESHMQWAGGFNFVRVVNVLHHFAGGAGDGAYPYGMLTRSGSTLYGATAGAWPSGSTRTGATSPRCAPSGVRATAPTRRAA